MEKEFCGRFFIFSEDNIYVEQERKIYGYEENNIYLELGARRHYSEELFLLLRKNVCEFAEFAELESQMWHETNSVE